MMDFLVLDPFLPSKVVPFIPGAFDVIDSHVKIVGMGEVWVGRPVVSLTLWASGSCICSSFHLSIPICLSFGRFMGLIRDASIYLRGLHCITRSQCTDRKSTRLNSSHQLISYA